MIERGRDARYVATGHLLYVVSGTLLAVPFDEERLEVTGAPVPMVEGLETTSLIGNSGAAQYSVSETGSLVYVSHSAQKARRLVWVDRHGSEEVLSAPPRAYYFPRLSPDGTRIALDIRDQENDIWIWDVHRETMMRFTFHPGADVNPTWTPDGQRVAFASARDGSQNLYWKSADGAGAVERLSESPNVQLPYAFTPDGAGLVFVELNTNGVDVGVLSLDGSTELVLNRALQEGAPSLSPDGKWLAFFVIASGQDEIYVRPFPIVDETQYLISSSPLCANIHETLRSLKLV